MNLRRGTLLAWVGVTLVMLLSALSVLAAVSVARAAPPQETALSGPGNHALSLTVGEHKRTFLVHVPAGYKPDAAKPLSVVLMLHGAGGEGKQVMKQTGWDKKADKEGFLAVFPNALPLFPKMEPSFARNPRFWEDGSGRGKRQNVDDTAFIAALLDYLAKRFPVDEKRVYVTGFSSGASMTFTLAAQLSERFAAAAPASGHFWLKDAPPARPVPLLLIYGTKDPLDPWEGGLVHSPLQPRGDVKPRVMDTVNAWVKLMGCPPQPVVISDKEGVKRVVYGPGKSGVEMTLLTIDGMGHAWAGGSEGGPSRIVGARSNKVNATDTLWEFFSRHVRAVRSVSP